MGVIETKCKRCGQIKIFQDFDENSLVNINRTSGHVLPKSVQLNCVTYGGKKYFFAVL